MDEVTSEVRKLRFKNVKVVVVAVGDIDDGVLDTLMAARHSPNLVRVASYDDMTQQKLPLLGLVCQMSSGSGLTTSDVYGSRQSVSGLKTGGSTSSLVGTKSVSFNVQPSNSLLGNRFSVSRSNFRSSVGSKSAASHSGSDSSLVGSRASASDLNNAESQQGKSLVSVLKSYRSSLVEPDGAGSDVRSSQSVSVPQSSITGSRAYVSNSARRSHLRLKSRLSQPSSSVSLSLPSRPNSRYSTSFSGRFGFSKPLDGSKQTASEASGHSVGKSADFGASIAAFGKRDSSFGDNSNSNSHSGFSYQSGSVYSSSSSSRSRTSSSSVSGSGFGSRTGSSSVSG